MPVYLSSATLGAPAGRGGRELSGRKPPIDPPPLADEVRDMLRSAPAAMTG